MSDDDPLKSLLRELVLAAGMIGVLILALWAHTGSMPPLVVVESSSMVHDPDGEIGSIDAGDLILVHNSPYSSIVTFSEATQPGNANFGYETHGLAGDVIIYAKNGEDGTPIIHRAILRVAANQTSTPDRSLDSTASESALCPNGGEYDPFSMDSDGQKGTCVHTWDAVGTSVLDVEKIVLAFDGEQTGYYDCDRPAHAGVKEYMEITGWIPEHAGIMTLGDNNQCSVDQGSQVVSGSSGVHSSTGVVGPIVEEWLLGVAGGEIPWMGTVKLMVSNSGPGTVYFPTSSFLYLFSTIAAILILPSVAEFAINNVIKNSPEAEKAVEEKQELDRAKSMREEE